MVEPDLREHLHASCDVPEAGIVARMKGFQEQLFCVPGINKSNLDISRLEKVVEGLPALDGVADKEDFWWLSNTEPTLRCKFLDII